MTISIATLDDFDYLVTVERHISESMLKQKLEACEILIASDNDTPIGYLRYNYFWDNTPFMNLLYIEEAYRRQGLGKQLVKHWENLMKDKGYARVMTSSLANEEAQFFYRKLGYKDAGSLLLPDEALEIIFIKTIKLSKLKTHVF
jgi:ribosomal protein S18 acetylase RimI-like enzyme